ncbi:hypothetical protein Tco_0536831, partial [Tanacetum coccineum]
DFQDSPNDEEDTRNNYEYLNDLEEEYQTRALLAKSKRFFKKGLKGSAMQKQLTKTGNATNVDKKDRMDVAEDRLLFREGPIDEEDARNKSDEDPDKVSDDDVSSESAALRALRRAALHVGIITGHNPNILFLTVVQILI